MTQTLKKKILFLGYAETRLIDHLRGMGCEITHTDREIASTAGFDLVVSFGYRHLLRGETLTGCPIVNLHIAYLPYNRGAHPNFWSFVENTPAGVTIHLIDAGIDTGPILCQKYVNFRKDEDTFLATYRRLVQELEELFIENSADILLSALTPKPQRGDGTFHRVADLPADFPGWETKIEEYVGYIDRVRKQCTAERLSIIGDIERVRISNNVNWMNLFRLAFKSSPEKAKKLVGMISSDDRKILELMSRLAE